MTRNDSTRDDDGPAMTPQARLRAALLTSGLYDWVPLAEVVTAMTHYRLAETTTEQQELALSTIRSLLSDGLMKIGGLPEPGELPDWGLSIEAAMDRLHDLYVTHHEDPVRWEFTTWLGLTDKGEQVARKLEDQAPH